MRTLHYQQLMQREMQFRDNSNKFNKGLTLGSSPLQTSWNHRQLYDSSTVNVIESEGAQSSAFEPLLRLTGRSLTAVSALAEDFPVKYPDPQNENAWVDTAFQNNYSLIAARARLRGAERGLQIAKSGHYPTIDGQVAWTHNVSGSSNFLGNKIDQRSLSLNLKSPSSRVGELDQALKQAGYNLEAARQNLDLVERQVAEATRILYTAVNTDVARVRARLRGIESSQSALDATQTGYEVGTRNIVDVLNAQQSLYLSQFQYAKARYTYVIDTLLLKQSVGTLNPEDLYALSRFLDNEETISQKHANHSIDVLIMRIFGATLSHYCGHRWDICICYQ